MELLNYEKEHADRLRKTLGECMVLLKSNGDFPLSESCKIALYGGGARRTIKGGTGSGEVNSRYFVTIEDGLKQAGFTITTSRWLDAYDKIMDDAHTQFVKGIKAEAKRLHTQAIFLGMGAVMPEPDYDIELDGDGDVAIYVLSRISGEGNDRKTVAGDVYLTNTELRDIKLLNEKYDKFMLVLNVGGPVDLSSVDFVENILLMSQLGAESGNGVADVLLGKQNPSGKLATTWTKYEDYPNIGDFGNRDNTRYQEGIYVGYRYFDSVGKKALYPFGFGKSFTEFEIHAEKVSQNKAVFTVAFSVNNIGKYAGKEVIQLYLSAPSGKIDRPYQELVGFAKTKELAAGEETKENISFCLTDFAAYDESAGRFVLEAGSYVLRLGNSSVNTYPVAVINVTEEITTRQVKNVLKAEGIDDWKPELRAISVPDHLVGFTISAADIETEKVEYDREYEIDPFVENLTNEQLANINTGAYSEAGLTSVVGNASVHLAGAAGETTSILKDQGMPPLIMADGPAGIRISKDYFADEKGQHSLGDVMPATMMEFLPKIATFFMKLLMPKPKKGQTVEHHYMTAIPIGTAIAQSFNIELAQDYGDIVGDEMERVGVHLWLAPALNIHRSILCGRNFEYYSEDPVVSGKFAGAITNGVQKHKGCGTTIKHYAANNQETNRYGNNSIVSERAMREIYLKGFEICVKESQPHAVMTSYNLLNGEHTAESRGLIEDILRAEFGYEGIVMTDWIIQGMAAKDGEYRTTLAGPVAIAGGDLFMPGSKKDVENILEYIADGRLTRKQLMINATRVYRMTVKSS